MQLPGPAILTNPGLGWGMWYSAKLRLGHLCNEGAYVKWALFLLSFRTGRNVEIDRNRPGLLRSELRSRRTLIVEQTNPW